MKITKCIRTKRSNEAGFSLVELMIVVAIIGILAAVATPNYKSMGDRAKALAVKAEMSLAIAKINEIHMGGDTLIDATGSGCTACAQGWATGVNPGSFENSGVATPAWKILGYDGIPNDPWGNPYILDENDEEFGPSDCRYDSIYSAGPDGVFQGPGDGVDVHGDDVIVRLPMLNPARCPGNDIDNQFGGHS